MPAIVLPPLPYPENALEPIISAKTIGLHYAKHHKGYVETLNNLLQRDSALASMTLEQIIASTAKRADKEEVFNSAAQVWNHNFYWRSMKPGGGKPKGDLAGRIDAAFGGFDNLKKVLAHAAVTQFGSGWAWLVAERDTLKVVKTGNAQEPFGKGQQPLLTIDVWEHAYYLDYQNRRPDYVNALIDKLMNWDFAAENLARLEHEPHGMLQ